MANHGRSGLVWFALATVVFLLLAGCPGFFVNPTLTGITVTPLTPTITPCPPPAGSVCTVQMVANGTFSDGSTSTIAASWSISPSDGSIATISTGGLVSGVAPGPATVTASSGTVSGTTSVTVTLANLQSIQVTPTNPTLSLAVGSVQFKATGTFSVGGQQDITNFVTWTSSDNTVALISNTTGSKGLATFLKTGTTNITATSGSIVSTPVDVLTIN